MADRKRPITVATEAWRNNVADAWRNLRDEIAKVIATRMIEGELATMPKPF